jgi:hypothetical protein
MQKEGIDFYKWFLKDKLDTKAISVRTGLDEGLVNAMKYFNKTTIDESITGKLDVVSLCRGEALSPEELSKVISSPDRLT